MRARYSANSQHSRISSEATGHQVDVKSVAAGVVVAEEDVAEDVEEEDAVVEDEADSVEVVLEAGDSVVLGEDDREVAALVVDGNLKNSRCLWNPGLEILKTKAARILKQIP